MIFYITFYKFIIFFNDHLFVSTQYNLGNFSVITQSISLGYFNKAMVFYFFNILINKRKKSLSCTNLYQILLKLVDFKHKKCKPKPAFLLISYSKINRLISLGFSISTLYQCQITIIHPLHLNVLY